MNCIVVHMIEEQLQSIIDDSNQHPTVVAKIISDAIIEIERLREYEFMYQSLNK